MNTLPTKSINSIEAKQHFEYVSDFSKYLFERMEKGLKYTDKGKLYSASTLRGYKSFIDNFNEFQETYYGIRIKFNQLNYGVSQDFISFLNSKGLAKNSVTQIVKKMKAILSEAFNYEYTYWNGSGVKTPTEITTQVSLSIAELKKMRQIQLTNSETQVLDFFIIQCFTGLRYHTLVTFLKNPYIYIREHEGFSYIDITDTKTGEQSIIPIGETVMEIMIRNNGSLKVYSDKHINKTIKQIASKAGIDNVMVKTITIGGEQKDIPKKKSDMISTHTARRTFATIMSRHFSKDDVSGMTGHKSVNQLNVYIRSSAISKVKHLFGHEAFSQKI